MKAKISMMLESMKKFWCMLMRAEGRKMIKELPTAGLANTGAKTNSEGVLLLENLNLPAEKMLKMSHANRPT